MEEIRRLVDVAMISLRAEIVGGMILSYSVSFVVVFVVVVIVVVVFSSSSCSSSCDRIREGRHMKASGKSND